MIKCQPSGTRKPSPKFAHRIWLEADRPSFRELRKLLACKGFNINESTLSRWKDLSPVWTSQYYEKFNPVDPAKLADVLLQAKEDAAELSPEHFSGLKTRLLFRLYQGIKSLNINTVDELSKGLECCDRIDALIHAERGKAVSEVGRINPDSGEKPSLITRLHPQVKLPPFKKPEDTA